MAAGTSRRALGEKEKQRLSKESIELQVVLITPGHQMVNLPPVGGLIPTRDEPNESGVIRELKEFDGLVIVYRKSVIHLQVESGTLSRESFSCSRFGMIVLKAELKSTNRI
ncbi:unnamed protein product [Pleuronectes platessa]|uniref:Uncharacterized protein n=1 Tax=Pleuronectes platessa TaxID=8262 RepID=A0A9N7YE58_PLEPL|nr:unnamed protein product [Pleuronectes platessa]